VVTQDTAESLDTLVILDRAFQVTVAQESQVIRDTVELAVTQGIPEFPAIQDIVASQAIAITRVFLVIQDLAFPDIQATAESQDTQDIVAYFLNRLFH